MIRGLVILSMAVFVGCSGDDPNRKETMSVVGEVYVNGEPGEGVMIKFHPEGGMDTAQPTETKSMVNADGKFAAGTYAVDDGATLGKHALTFTLPKLNRISMTFGGDELKGRYADPQKSTHTVTVESGKPIDLGRIDL